MWMDIFEGSKTLTFEGLPNINEYFLSNKLQSEGLILYSGIIRGPRSKFIIIAGTFIKICLETDK